MVLAQLTFIPLMRADGEPAYAREIKGGVEFAPGRVLAWEFVSDGSGRDEMQLLETGKEPRSLGRAPGEVTAAAVGADTMVVIAGGKPFSTSFSNPGIFTAIQIESEWDWTSVAFGPKGFVLTGWGDMCAISSDGQSWRRIPWKAEVEGGLAQVAVGPDGYAVLRQTSLSDGGWNSNVSEVWTSANGRDWKNAGGVRGGETDAPLVRLRWLGNRWVGSGAVYFFTLTRTGENQIIPVQMPDNIIEGLTGEEPLLHAQGTWRLVLGNQLLASNDLKTWKLEKKMDNTRISGAWIATISGEPLLLGRSGPGWSEQRFSAVAALPAGTVREAPAPGAPAPSVSPAEAFAAEVARQEALAEAGEVKAMVALASLYRSPGSRYKGVEADVHLAADWYQKAGDKGDVGSMRQVSDMFWNGDLGRRDYASSIKWTEKAAALGDMGAMVNLADHLSRGVPAAGLKADPVKSLEWYRKAEAKGSHMASYRIADAYKSGNGVPVDYEKAREYFTKAAPHVVQAKNALASLDDDIAAEAKKKADQLAAATTRVALATGALPVMRDAAGNLELAPPSRVVASPAAAEKRLTESLAMAAQVDNPSRNRGVALAVYFEGIDSGPNALPAADVEWLMRDRIARLAQLDFYALVEAQKALTGTRLGSFGRWMTGEQQRALTAVYQSIAAAGPNAKPTYAGYPPGRGWTQNEMDRFQAAYRAQKYNEAVTWARQAANKGDPWAMRALGVCYRDGQGVEKDEAQSLLWMQRGADRGDMPASLEVGKAYHLGKGVPVNHTLARAWYEAALLRNDQGETARDIRANLGVLLMEGQGGPKDPARALAYFRQGAEAGHVMSIHYVGVAYERGEGVPKDAKLAEEWYEKAAAKNFEPAKAALQRIDYRDWLLDVAEASEEIETKGNALLTAQANEAKTNESVKDAAGKTLTGNVPPPVATTATGRPMLPLPPPRGTVLKGVKPREPDTVYDWSAIMAAAVKRAAAEPDYVPSESVLKLRGTKKSKWTKGTPWSAQDMLAAMRKGATAAEVVEVMKLEYDGSLLDKPGILTVLTSKEWSEALARTSNLFDVEHYMLRADLWGQVMQRSKLADALAREVISRRQKDVPPTPKPVDSPELRRRYAAGDAEAAYQLYQLYYGLQDSRDRIPAPKDLPPGDQLLAQATKDYAPAQWMLAPQFQNHADKTKNDPVRVFELYWTSAMAGDAIGAFELAQLFAAPGNEAGVARNYAESEYWFIEAAVRGWPGQMDLHYRRPWLELANLYSAQSPNDTMSTLMATYEDATARWLRLMGSRGGVMADYAKLAATYFNLESRGNPTPFNYEKRVAAMPPELPVLSDAEWRKIEAGAAGHAKDLLRVAEAYAGGRLVRQNDVKAVEFYRKAADAGAGLPAYRALAWHYQKGYGVNPDPVQLVAWMTKAAETNDVPSLVAFADAQHFVNSDGVAQNYNAAMAAYEKAAALGDVRSLYNIALMHRYGRGGPKDEKKWREFMEQAAGKGYIPAMRDIGYSYITSELTAEAKDYAQAVVWYQKAVDAGDKGMRFGLAEALRGAKDKEGARKWYLEVAYDDPNDVRSRYQLAQEARWDGRRDEAAKWFREITRLKTIYDFMKETAQEFVREYDEEESAKPGSLLAYRKKAKTGTPDDMFDYAIRVAPTKRDEADSWISAAAREGHAQSTAIYYAEWAKKDKPAADKWIKDLAAKGNTQAMLIEGLLLAPTDKAAGLALVQKAADAGNAEAKFRIGTMKYTGNDLPQDRAAGLVLITAAADAGFPLAQAALGKSLVTGDVGVTSDPARGVSYLRKAAEQFYVPQVAAQASLLLGQIYERGAGAGVPASKGDAVNYYRQALKAGPNPQLKAHVDQLEQQWVRERKGME